MSNYNRCLLCNKEILSFYPNKNEKICFFCKKKEHKKESSRIRGKRYRNKPESKEKKKKYMKEYRKNNREDWNEYRRKWRKENPDKDKAIRRNFYLRKKQRENDNKMFLLQKEI